MSWWILAFLGVASIVSLFYWGSRTTENQVAQHEKVKSLLEENKELSQEIHKLEMESDKKLDLAFKTHREMQAAYLKQLSLNKLGQMEIEKEYDKKYLIIDNSPVDSVIEFISNELSKADSF